MLYILGYYLAMKLILIIYNLLLTMYVHSKEYFDYIIDNNAKRTIVMEHNFNETSFFRAFKLEGSFTDNLGNYGNWSSIVNAEIENNILKYHAFSLRYSYQNGSIVFAKGNRTNDELEQGIGKVKYISAPKILSPLIGTVCNYGVSFLKETAFVIFKCDITPEIKKLLTSIKKIN